MTYDPHDYDAVESPDVFSDVEFPDVEFPTLGPSATVLLRVQAPWTSMTFAEYPGGTLVIDTKGVPVPAAAANALIQTAAQHGVTLTEARN